MSDLSEHPTVCLPCIKNQSSVPDQSSVPEQSSVTEEETQFNLEKMLSDPEFMKNLPEENKEMLNRMLINQRIQHEIEQGNIYQNKQQSGKNLLVTKTVKIGESEYIIEEKQFDSERKYQMWKRLNDKVNPNQKKLRIEAEKHDKLSESNDSDMKKKRKRKRKKKKNVGVNESIEDVVGDEV